MIIRKVYSRLARQVIKQKGISLLARISSQYALINLSRAVGRPICGPLLGILIVTYRCNLRCTYCDMPDTARGECREEFDTAAFCGVIDELVRLGVKAIVFTGGEPLLRSDIYELIAYAHKRGIMTHLSTNGMLVGGDDARKLIASGISSISVSLDGSSAEIHERTRKRAGAFSAALSGLSSLVREREVQKASVYIKVLTVVNKSNIEDIPNLIHFARKQGSDGVELMPCQSLFKGTHGYGVVHDSDFIRQVDDLIAQISAKDELIGFIENSASHLKLFKKSFTGKPSPLPCYAGSASLVVDCYGDVFPCHPWANWGHLPLNIKGRNLESIWQSKEYAERRALTVQCGSCYLNCQAELSIMLGIARKLVKKNF